MSEYVQKNERATKKNKKAWLLWLKGYGAAKFLDSFLLTVEGAESTCVQCKQKIYVDVLIGGGVPDWSDAGGDFGCSGNVLEWEDMGDGTKAAGCGGHVPRKRA